MAENVEDKEVEVREGRMGRGAKKGVLGLWRVLDLASGAKFPGLALVKMW